MSLYLRKRLQKRGKKRVPRGEKRHTWDQNGTRVGKIHQPMSNQPLSSGQESMQSNQHEKRVLLRFELHRWQHMKGASLTRGRSEQAVQIGWWCPDARFGLGGSLDSTLFWAKTEQVTSLPPPLPEHFCLYLKSALLLSTLINLSGATLSRLPIISSFGVWLLWFLILVQQCNLGLQALSTC